MKNFPLHFIAVVLLFFLLEPLQAQDKQSVKVGFQLQELQASFGLGLHVTVPLPRYWPNVRVAGNWHWLEVPGETGPQLADFQTFRIGLASDGWQVAEKIRVYGEGGTLLIHAGSKLSDKALTPGGYGLFGFEFFTNRAGGSSLYLEMGATSAGLRVERPDGIPRFGAGFLLGAGFRVAL